MTVAQTESSKVVLCTVYDEPSLRTGEFLYDEDTDTLYVGTGVSDDIVLYITKFIKHHTSVKHIPAPRIKLSKSVDMPNITFDSTYRVIEPPKISLHLDVVTPTIERYTSSRVTNLIKLTLTNEVDVPNITHNTEVLYE